MMILLHICRNKYYKYYFVIIILINRIKDYIITYLYYVSNDDIIYKLQLKTKYV